MTKNIFENAWKLISLLLVLLPALTLTACGDDNDEPEVPTSKYKKILIEYSASVGEGYSMFWDVELTYTTPGGENKTIDLDMDWVETYYLNPGDEIPTNYVLNIVAKPNPNAPTPVDDEKYAIDKAYRFVAYGVTNDDSKVILGGDPIGFSHTGLTTGAKIKELMGEQKKIADKTYTIEL